MFDLTTLFISYHAVLRYVQRVKREYLPEDYRFSKQEYDRYLFEILAVINKARPLPTQLCLLFSRLGTNTREQRAVHRSLANQESAASGATSFGEYYFDGEACYVIEGNRLVTVILPDDAQYRTIDDWFAREDRRQQQECVSVAAPMTVETASDKASSTTAVQQAIRIIFLPQDFHAYKGLLVWVKNVSEGREVRLFHEEALSDALSLVVKELSISRLSLCCLPSVFEAQKQTTQQRESLSSRVSRYAASASASNVELVFVCGSGTFFNVMISLSAAEKVTPITGLPRSPERPIVCTLRPNPDKSQRRWRVASQAKPQAADATR